MVKHRGVRTKFAEKMSVLFDVTDTLLSKTTHVRLGINTYKTRKKAIPLVPSEAASSLVFAAKISFCIRLVDSVRGCLNT